MSAFEEQEDELIEEGVWRHYLVDAPEPTPSHDHISAK